MLDDFVTFCSAAFPGRRDGLVNKGSIAYTGIQLTPRHCTLLGIMYTDGLISQWCPLRNRCSVRTPTQGENPAFPPGL